ncbi:MAG: plasmid partition protein ParG [Rhizonema sp. PD37]|nr:plasmid partition protein ParG [Rhizonema sp. PD37]
MHISITDNTKKRFHFSCAIRGLKMSQVVVDLIEQWLKNNDVAVSGVEEDELVK